MRALRAGLILVGVVGIGYGAWLLVDRQRPGQLVEVAVWLGAAIVVHDVVLAPLLIVLGWAAGRWLPRPAARGAVVVLVLLGPAVLLAVPVLGGFGAVPDNPTLLDRNYLAGLIGYAVLCLLAGLVLALAWARPRARREEE